MTRRNVTIVTEFALRIHDRRGPAQDTILYQRPGGPIFQIWDGGCARFVPGKGWIACKITELEVG